MLAFALFLACTLRPTTLEDVPVVRAWLAGADFNSGAIIGGVVTGDAILMVEDNTGALWSERVTLRGPVVSIGVETTGDPELGGPIPLELPQGQLLTGAQLLGTYRGPAQAIAVGVGVSARQLKNRHDVRFREVHLSIGVAAMVGFEWLRVAPGGREGLVDTAPAPIDSAPIDSMALDTGPIVDSTPGDSADAVDSGDRSTGCSCAGDTRDTALESLETGEDSEDEDSPSDSPGESEADDSGDDDSSSTCSSRPGGMRSGLLALVLAFVLRRRHGAQPTSIIDASKSTPSPS